MLKKYLRISLLLIFGLTVSTGFSQTKAQKERITSKYDIGKLNQLKRAFSAKAAADKRKALRMARINNWPLKITKNKRGQLVYMELQSVTSKGKPIYYTTFNVDASRSTRANHLNNGGTLGLDLEGQNMTAHVWDAGIARATHQEYDGVGGDNRMSAGGDGASLNFHSAHVTGTIMASGFDPAAKGMAPQASAVGFDWNTDIAEATEQAANGMIISNHSYGLNPSFLDDYYFGGYIEESRDWDELHFNAPYYLMVVAAGNSGNDSTTNGTPLEGNSGFDKLTDHTCAKNNLAVANALDANVDDNGNLIGVTINSGSSQGPTDDYRIKPEITGNGTGVYSTYETADDAYNSISGTSMASPNVAGSLLLLQQHHSNLENGELMLAATLKGLALHTADDAGLEGPDTVYGWGLLNAKRAAQTITESRGAADDSAVIEERTLTDGQSYSVSVFGDGINPLIASISWTDRPGVATTNLNDTTPTLVNDLDIRITQNGNTWSPWKLTSVNTNDKGDNIVDPFERIEVIGTSGEYTITVTHKGSLVGGSQNYSLIVSGISPTEVTCEVAVPENLGLNGIGAYNAVISWDLVPAVPNYDVRYREVGTSTWTDVPGVIGSTLSIINLNIGTSYEAQIRANCPDGSTSDYSGSFNFTTSDVPVNYCDSMGNNVSDEYIGKVEVGSIDNSSGSENGGYSDFTAISTNLNIGVENTLTVTPVWTGTLYNEGYAAWIDYNRDENFSEDELIFSQSPTQNTPVSGNFTVPASALEGGTRLRVSMKYNGIPDPCESFGFGEVEDYTVNIIGDGGGDTEAPSVPGNLTAANTTQTTTDLSWDASTDNVGVTAYTVYQDGSALATVSGTSHPVTGLTASTTYSFTVSASDAAGNESAESNSVSVTTLDEVVDTEAPSVPANLTAANTTQTTTDLSWDASTDNVGVTAYTVYQDGAVVDTVSGTSYSVTGLTASTTYSFTVSASDAAGNESAESNAVSVTTLDEVVDTEAPSVPGNLVAANTTQTTTDLSWDASTDNVGVTGYTVFQDGTSIATVSGTSYGVTGLTANTTYSFTVSASDAAGNESAQSNAVSVTTLEEPGGTYCESSSNNTSDEFIGRVQLGDIDNESGPTFYSDFTDLSTVLTKGEDNTITITATWTGFQFSEGYAVWIDYNQDYDFEDEGELVFSQDPINTAPVEGTFVVPQDAVNGPTRMRVSMKFSDIPDPCENFTYGEVEDYTVDISGDITEVISEGYFETGWDGWVDGGADAFRYAGSRSFEGIRSIRLRDNSGESSSMTLEDVDLSTYDKLNVSFYYYANSMESGEDFLLQYYDGANWNTVASWVSGTDFTNGSFFSGEVTISDADYAFPADAQIRIQCDAGNNADQVFIDQVIVKGIISEENVGAAVAAGSQSASAGSTGAVVVAKRPVQENEYVIYPNPVRENLNYKATLSTQASYIITNIMGQQVRSGKSSGQSGSINVNGLPQGVYIIMFNEGGNVKYYKFIKR